MPTLCDYIRTIRVIILLQHYLYGINICGFDSGPVTGLCLLTVILQIGVCIILCIPLLYCAAAAFFGLYYQEDPATSTMGDLKQEIAALLPDVIEESHRESDRKGSIQVRDNLKQPVSTRTTKDCESTVPPLPKRPCPIKIIKFEETNGFDSKSHDSTPISVLCASIKNGFVHSESRDPNHESDSTPISHLCDSIVKDFAHLESHIEVASSPSLVVKPLNLRRTDQVAPLNLQSIRSRQLLQKQVESSLRPESLSIPQKRPYPRRRPPPLQLDLDLVPRPLRIVKKNL